MTKKNSPIHDIIDNYQSRGILAHDYYHYRMHYDHPPEIIKTVSELYKSKDVNDLRIAVEILKATKQSYRNGERGKY
jgi:hypothetical protein